MKDSDWVHNDDPLECGVKLTKYAINLWRKPALIADWQRGETLRTLSDKYKISHETARKWTEKMTRRQGASRHIRTARQEPDTS